MRGRYVWWLLGSVIVMLIEVASIVAISSGISTALWVIVPTAGLAVCCVAAGWLFQRRDTMSVRALRLRSRNPAALTSELAGLPLRRLCAQWRASAQELAKTSRSGQSLRLVRVRAQILDELERRDPVGFAHWLGTEPFEGNPAEYLRSDNASPPSERPPNDGPPSEGPVTSR